MMKNFIKSICIFLPLFLLSCSNDDYGVIEYDESSELVSHNNYIDTSIVSNQAFLVEAEDYGDDYGNSVFIIPDEVYSGVVWMKLRYTNEAINSGVFFKDKVSNYLIENQFFSVDYRTEVIAYNSENHESVSEFLDFYFDNNLLEAASLITVISYDYLPDTLYSERQIVSDALYMGQAILYDIEEFRFQNGVEILKKVLLIDGCCLGLENEGRVSDYGAIVDLNSFVILHE